MGKTPCTSGRCVGQCAVAADTWLCVCVCVYLWSVHSCVVCVVACERVCVCVHACVSVFSGGACLSCRLDVQEALPLFTSRTWMTPWT